MTAVEVVREELEHIQRIWKIIKETVEWCLQVVRGIAELLELHDVGRCGVNRVGIAEPWQVQLQLWQRCLVETEKRFSKTVVRA